MGLVRVSMIVAGMTIALMLFDVAMTSSRGQTAPNCKFASDGCRSETTADEAVCSFSGLSRRASATEVDDARQRG